ELLPQVHQTLDAARDMGNSLNGAVNSLDTFVRYVSPPETNRAPPSTNSHPFNVVEFGTAAQHIATMSKHLDTLRTPAHHSATQVVFVSEQAGAKVDRAVNRAFLLGLVLVVVLLAGAVLAGLAFRVLAARLARRPDRPTAAAP